jgi:leucyl-tRNA synthetase
MVTAAFPYVNAPQHIGHLRTYGTADALARYKRMRGFNVLYPMAFHGTGTPVLAFAKRIREGDKELIDEFKVFHISDEEIRKMVDPEYIIRYFSAEVEAGMKRAGYSIDWRRKFISTDAVFSRFVEWQFGVLEEKGLFVKGRHPVGWCTNDNNPVGMHDTRHDLEPEIEAETAIKFKVDGEDSFIVCATYRPETLYGVTNLFIKSDAEYALCRVGGDKVYMAKAAADIIKYQMEVVVEHAVDASEMLKKVCINPLTGERLPVLPGFFVKEGLGTGAVMSVPAHAPFDYAAIERLKASGYQMPMIEPKKVINVEIGRSLSDVSTGEAKPSQSELPALAYMEILHTNVNAIDDMLEFATKLQYREESHWGRMSVKGYEGMSEPEARVKIKKELENSGSSFEIYVVANQPVKCRCGTDVLVKVVDDQWFLNYGNEEWKALAREALKGTSVYPDKLRRTFETVIEWINLRAVARSQGLGTKFPLDKKLIIESLSDSTMYMAFYTFNLHLKDQDLSILGKEFFDYVVLGKGDIDAVAAATGASYELLKRCRESFAYWYTNTSRSSGADLVFNHLTMYLFNHAIILDRKFWPKQIVTNGMVLSEGEKMSKSLGNIVPLTDGIERYGADPLRILEVAGADLFSDSEFGIAAWNGVRERIEYLSSVIGKLDSMETKPMSSMDYLMYSRMNRKIQLATEAMDALELRGAATEIFYNSVIDLKEYAKRGGSNGIVLRDFLQGMVLMMQPLAPHISEELWHALGNDSFASTSKWPSSDSGMIDKKLEMLEERMDKTISDARHTLDLVGRKGGQAPKEVRIIIASDWKRDAVNMLAETKDPGRVIENIKTERKDAKPGDIEKYVSVLAKGMNRLESSDITCDEEYKHMAESEQYISSGLGGIVVTVEKEDGSGSARAHRAAPLRPSIDIILG